MVRNVHESAVDSVMILTIESIVANSKETRLLVKKLKKRASRIEFSASEDDLDLLRDISSS